MFEFKKTSQQQKRRFRLRAWVGGLFALICFGVLVGRLWNLQVHRYEGLSERADRNRITVVPIAPRRGEYQVLYTQFAQIAREKGRMPEKAPAPPGCKERPAGPQRGRFPGTGAAYAGVPAPPGKAARGRRDHAVSDDSGALPVYS